MAFIMVSRETNIQVLSIVEPAMSWLLQVKREMLRTDDARKSKTTVKQYPREKSALQHTIARRRIFIDDYGGSAGLEPATSCL